MANPIVQMVAELEQENKDIKAKLVEMSVALEERNTQIEQLNLGNITQANNYSADLQAMRERCRQLQDERDEAVTHAAHLKVLFHSLWVQLTEFSFPLPTPEIVKERLKGGAKTGRITSKKGHTEEIDNGVKIGSFEVPNDLGVASNGDAFIVNMDLRK